VLGLDQQDVAWAEVGARFLDSLILRVNVANGAGARRPGRRSDLHAARPDRERAVLAQCAVANCWLFGVIPVWQPMTRAGGLSSAYRKPHTC
jgi:hypothetical protein